MRLVLDSARFCLLFLTINSNSQTSALKSRGCNEKTGLDEIHRPMTNETAPELRDWGDCTDLAALSGQSKNAFQVGNAV